jgi:hypothetical protein
MTVEAGASHILAAHSARIVVMPFTLWSRGRLLGETDLGFVQIYSNMRMGWFHPSPLGAQLMSVLTGTGPALRKVGRLMRNPIRNAMRQPSNDDDGEWPKDIRATTAYADLVSSVDELEALGIELRDPDGRTMEAEHIGIDDIEFKLSFISKRDRRRLGIDKPEPWRAEEKDERYQIQVYFPGPRTLLVETNDDS